MTETMPEVEAAPAPPPPATEPVADTVMTTGDHKRLGRLYLVVSLMFLVVGGVTGAVLGAERVDSGIDVLTSTSFGDVFTLHGVTVTFLFLLPAWIGLATYVVPLQVGAPNIALPRASALGFWGYVVGGAMLIGSHLGGGGHPGPSDVKADQLWILGLGLVLTAALVGLVSIVTTALAYRAPGMTLKRTPAFTWSMIIGGSLLILTIPVLLAGLTLAYVDLTNGGTLFEGDFLRGIGWAFGAPQIYLLAVPALGVVTEVLATFGRARASAWPVTIAAMGAFGVLGTGAWFAAATLAGADPTTEFLYQAVGLATVAPALVLLAMWADTLRRSNGVQVSTALLFAVGTVFATVLAAVIGAVGSVDRLDLVGTTWMAAHIHATLGGIGTLGLFAGLYYWGPKIWGATLPEGAGKLQFLVSFAGAALLVLPDIYTGAQKMPFGATEFDAESSWGALNAIAAIGGVLVVVGVALLLANVLLAATDRRRSNPAGDDPWGGHTLEWATSSPPPQHNFDALPAITSDAPLLDLRGNAATPEGQQ